MRGLEVHLILALPSFLRGNSRLSPAGLFLCLTSGELPTIPVWLRASVAHLFLSVRSLISQFVVSPPRRPRFHWLPRQKVASQYGGTQLARPHRTCCLGPGGLFPVQRMCDCVVFSVNWGNKLCMIDLGPRFPPNVPPAPCTYRVLSLCGLIPGFFLPVFLSLRLPVICDLHSISETKKEKKKNLLLRGVCPVWNVVWARVYSRLGALFIRISGTGSSNR